MTQLIAVICDEGKQVITLSDRMLSTGDMTLMFEHPGMKTVPISSKAVVMTAGTAHEPDLLRQAKEDAKGKDRILDIAEVLKKNYQEARDKHIVDEVLRPLAGLKSFNDWHQRQTSLHDSLVLDLNAGVRRYELGLTLILAGVDDRGHVIRIGDPGTYRSFDSVSYCCVGMGDRHADNVFAWYRYSEAFPLCEAIYITYEAKKRSEMAGGIGRATDIAIIDNEGIKVVEEATIKTLEGVYNERESRSAREEFDGRITHLEVQTRKLGAEKT